MNPYSTGQNLDSNQHHEQPAESNKLTDHHAELENLLVGEFGFHAIKKLIIHIAMIGG